MDTPRTRLVLLIIGRGLIRGQDTDSPGQTGAHTDVAWTVDTLCARAVLRGFLGVNDEVIGLTSLWQV